MEYIAGVAVCTIKIEEIRKLIYPNKILYAMSQMLSYLKVKLYSEMVKKYQMECQSPLNRRFRLLQLYCFHNTLADLEGQWLNR